MAKFSGSTHTIAAPLGPTRATGSVRTHEGGQGFDKDAKTALYTLAVTNMVSDATFYESGGDRDQRFRGLVAEVTRQDPTWVARFVPWLRNDANMRSAAVVVACEYVKAGGEHGRYVISDACVRPDEPAEVLGYWLATYGRKVPKPVKRGLADACTRLYGQNAAIKYDGGSRGIRMGDVIELVHPEPKDALQSALFRHLIDRRHNRDLDLGALGEANLDRLVNAYTLDQVPTEERRARLGSEQLADAGYTWERLSGWLPGGMDAEAWEAIIPSMGLMALIRNLRNFEEAKVSPAARTAIALRISDPAEVARSRQFPYRFWSAYKNSGTMFFGPALETALELSVKNVPKFPGRTLVMVDTSGSMTSPVSSRSQIQLLELGALFAASVAAGNDVTLCPYASDTYIAPVKQSVMRTINDIVSQVGKVGHGTQTWASVQKQYRGHDRIIVFTDMQDHPARVAGLPNVPVYVWDLRGYAAANVDTDVRGRYLFAGFTDSAFRMVDLLERGNDVGWPWEQG